MMSPGQASSASSRSRAKKKIGLCTASALAGARRCFSFMPRRKRPEQSRTKATRSRCLRVDVGLHLEDEAGDLGLLRRDRRAARPAAAAAAAPASASPSSNSPTAEVLERAAEDRPASDGPRDRRRGRTPGIGRARQLDLSRNSRARPRRRRSSRSGSSRPRAARSCATASPRRARTAAAGRGAGRRCRGNRGPMPIGQVAGATSSASVCSISSSSSNGSRASRSILLTKVMIGTSRSRQTSNSLRVCASMPLAASITMIARIDRGQRAVGVLAEVLVARRVEQVEDETRRCSKRHHRARHRDAALPLDRHPVGARAPPIAARLDLAGELDRAAEQQQLLGQRGLARVRVRDDREGPPGQRRAPAG